MGDFCVSRGENSLCFVYLFLLSVLESFRVYPFLGRVSVKAYQRNASFSYRCSYNSVPILILMLHPQWPRANLENAKVCAYTDWTIENGWSWLCDHIAKISGENKALLSLCVQSCTMLFVSSNTLPHISPVWYISDDKQEGEMAVIGWELERHKHRYEHTTAMLNASRKVNSTGAVKKMSANLLL